VLRELAHEDGDVEKRADTAQVPKVALVRCPAQPVDLGLEVERWAVHVPEGDGTAPTRKVWIVPGGTKAASPEVSVRHALPIETSREPSSTSYSSVRRGWMWG
jgi:hypothetical protein